MQRADTPPTVAELFGRTVTAAGTRDRLLHAALDLFYTYGFHEVGLDRVIGVVGVTKTTFYKHFESRDDLIMEAVALRDAWLSDAFTECIRRRAGDDPRAGLLAMFDVLDEWFNDPAFEQCIFISACTEFPWRDHPVHRVAARFYERTIEQVAATAAAVGAANPSELAHSWVLLLQGALTQRMTIGDNAAARRARPIAEALLAVHAPSLAPAARAG
jgi:AcrR family transcriptional regulator